MRAMLVGLLLLSGCMGDPRMQQLVEEVRRLREQRSAEEVVGQQTQELRAELQAAFGPMRKALEGLVAQQQGDRKRLAALSEEVLDALGEVKGIAASAEREKLDAMQTKLRGLQKDLRQAAAARERDQALILEALNMTADKLDGFLQRVRKLQQAAPPAAEHEGDGSGAQASLPRWIGGVTAVVVALAAFGWWHWRGGRSAAKAGSAPAGEAAQEVEKLGAEAFGAEEHAVEPVEAPEVDAPLEGTAAGRATGVPVEARTIDSLAGGGDPAENAEIPPPETPPVKAVPVEAQSPAPTAGELLEESSDEEAAEPAAESSEAAPVAVVRELIHGAPAALGERVRAFLDSEPAVLVEPRPAVSRTRRGLWVCYHLVPDAPAADALRIERSLERLAAGEELPPAPGDSGNRATQTYTPRPFTTV